jgi:hypothetical protein
MEVERRCTIEERTYRHLHASRDTHTVSRRIAPVALCSQCEYCVELTRQQLLAYAT